MPGDSEFSGLIEAIYDAGLQPALWNDVVVRINKFVGGRACGLFSKDSISKCGVTHYYCGADPHYIQLYSDTYSRFDPLTILPRFGHVVSIPDLVCFDEYRRGRFYQEWLRPQGCIDAANVVLENSKSNCPVLMTVLAGKRMVDAEMRRRVARIVPHAHRALMINRAIESRKSETLAFSEIVDGLSAGIFLLDADCRIVHANAAAREILGADDVLRAIGGQLVAREAQANRTLRETFAAGVYHSSSARMMALPLTAHDGNRFVAHMLPLKSLVRNGSGAVLNAVAALFVRRVELDAGSYGELIARTFALTPAELRVLRSIVEVGGVPETAENLGVAETTVKTHLHRVFAKTGASRQADLVKLAAGFSNPLAMAEKRATSAAREDGFRPAHLRSSNPDNAGPADTAYQLPIDR
jgi:DNA-binding CsgD family transcriptional regulator/PAS domain-containing protein